MTQDEEVARTLRAMIEEIDVALLDLIRARRGLDHAHLQRIATLETARNAAWRLLLSRETATDSGRIDG